MGDRLIADKVVEIFGASLRAEMGARGSAGEVGWLLGHRRTAHTRAGRTSTGTFGSDRGREYKRGGIVSSETCASQLASRISIRALEEVT